MKNILLFFLVIFTIAVKAQINLVPNPSFEDTINCPYQSGDIGKATGWTTLCGSPDFFNICNQYDWGVPNNIFGYQQAASGNAYAGFATYSSDSPESREFAACNLSIPLIIGTKYYISFKVALSLNSMSQTNYASDKIGATFTTGTYICNSLITNNPPVFTDSIITDSLNWTRITGFFVADSAYTYLAIGNFFDDANTDTVKFFNDFSDNAYYYLDDVAVSTDSSFVYNYSYSTSITESNLQHQITVYPNPANNFINIQSGFNAPFDIVIYNSNGQLLYTEQDVNTDNLQLDINPYNSGLLFIKITSQNNQFMYKLLKQ